MKCQLPPLQPVTNKLHFSYSSPTSAAQPNPNISPPTAGGKIWSFHVPVLKCSSCQTLWRAKSLEANKANHSEEKHRETLRTIHKRQVISTQKTPLCQVWMCRQTYIGDGVYFLYPCSPSPSNVKDADWVTVPALYQSCCPVYSIAAEAVLKLLKNCFCLKS